MPVDPGMRKSRPGRGGAISVREEEFDSSYGYGRTGYAGRKDDPRMGKKKEKKKPEEPEPPYTLLPGFEKALVQRRTLLRGMYG